MIDKVGNLAIVALALCAMLLTGMTIKHEYLKADGRDGHAITVSDWKSYGQSSPYVGTRTPTVKVAIFSDYECPFCRALNSKIEALRASRPDAQFVFLNFPLAGHPQALPAARAAVCAADQGRFEQYHNALFAQSTGESWNFRELATQLGLDSVHFDACLKSARTDSVIQRDLAAGEKLGVKGTPALLINDKLYFGLPANLEDLVRKAKPLEN